jgi:hypothetical protein
MMTLWQDLLYAGRRLGKSPGFALAAVLTLALGIGANTAIFQLIEAVQLRSLPVKDPAGLVEIRIADMEGARGAFSSWHAERPTRCGRRSGGVSTPCRASSPGARRG